MYFIKGLIKLSIALFLLCFSIVPAAFAYYFLSPGENSSSPPTIAIIVATVLWWYSMKLGDKVMDKLIETFDL